MHNKKKYLLKTLIRDVYKDNILKIYNKNTYKKCMLRIDIRPACKEYI